MEERESFDALSLNQLQYWSPSDHDWRKVPTESCRALTGIKYRVKPHGCAEEKSMTSEDGTGLVSISKPVGCPDYDELEGGLPEAYYEWYADKLEDELHDWDDDEDVEDYDSWEDVWEFLNL